MEPLTRREDQALRILYRLERAFIKDVVAEFPDPKPAYTTVSTLIRRLEQKGYVGHEDFGPTYRYYPTLPREQFFGRDLKRVVTDFFGNSHKALVSHFARSKKLSRADLEDILRMIDEQE